VIGGLVSALDRLPGWIRRGMVIVVPLLLFGVLVAAFALAPSEGGPPARRSTAADRLLPPAASNTATAAPTLGGPRQRSSTPPARTPTLAVAPDEPLPRASPLRRMVATARSFAGAYLVHEIGRLSRPVRRTIVATCTPAFARYLLAQPAHLAGLYAAHPRDVEVDRVVSVSFAGGRNVEVSFVTEQNSADSGAFLVKLAPAGGRWLVASVGL